MKKDKELLEQVDATLNYSVDFNVADQEHTEERVNEICLLLFNYYNLHGKLTAYKAVYGLLDRKHKKTKAFVYKKLKALVFAMAISIQKIEDGGKEEDGGKDEV